MITLEQQLDLAHRFQAQVARETFTHSTNPRHKSHEELNVAKAICETIERAIGCRDCANSDWPKETKGVSAS
jgi:hypothetical protein